MSGSVGKTVRRKSASVKVGLGKRADLWELEFTGDKTHVTKLIYLDYCPSPPLLMQQTPLLALLN